MGIPRPRQFQFLGCDQWYANRRSFPALGSTNSFNANGTGFYTFDGTYGYGDYGWLLATSLTNSPAALQALYPGLQISSSFSYEGYVTNYVFVQYFTNQSGVGTTYPPPLVLVTASNKVVTLQTKLYCNHLSPMSFPVNVSPTTTEKLIVTSVTPNTGAPFGSPPVTNSPSPKPHPEHAIRLLLHTAVVSNQRLSQ